MIMDAFSTFSKYLNADSLEDYNRVRSKLVFIEVTRERFNSGKQEYIGAMHYVHLLAAIGWK